MFTEILSVRVDGRPVIVTTVCVNVSIVGYAPAGTAEHPPEPTTFKFPVEIARVVVVVVWAWLAEVSSKPATAHAVNLMTPLLGDDCLDAVPTQIHALVEVCLG
jgi:hypothetical protein